MKWVLLILAFIVIRIIKSNTIDISEYIANLIYQIWCKEK